MKRIGVWKYIVVFLCTLFMIPFVDFSPIHANAIPKDIDNHEYIVSDDDVYSVLNDYREEYGFEDSRNEFFLDSVLDVAYGRIYKLCQIKDGYTVYGRVMNIAVDNDNKVLSINGNYILIPSLKEIFVSEEEAMDIANDKYGASFSKGLNVYSLYEYENKAELAYHIVTNTARLFISSYDGAVLAEFPLSDCDIDSKQTDAFGNEVSVPVQVFGSRPNRRYYLSDYLRNIFTYMPDPEDPENFIAYVTDDNGVFGDPMAISIYNNVLKAYDFYTEEDNIGAVLYGINGQNDKISGNWDSRREEIPINVLVHYGDKYENVQFVYVEEYKIAYIMVGDGNINSSIYNPGKALDVIAHEYQHGITEMTAGLIYFNESGAINEAVSDMFGALVEDYELSDERFWLLGEDASPNGCLRTMKGTSKNYSVNAISKKPLCFREHEHTTCDNGSVHGNSTILTHAQYKMWRLMPEFFTKELIGKLWYSTLCSLSPDADFADFADVFYESAVNLGFPQNVLEVIESCFFSSGITEQEGVHNVKFVNDDGSLLDEVTVKDGEAPYEPDDPTKPSSATVDYTFCGWDQPIDKVTEDMTVKALYTESPRKFTVTFQYENGEVISTDIVEYGGKAKPPEEIPKKESTDLYDYEFLDWNQSFEEVTCDLNVVALFRDIRCFNVDFVNGGTILKSERVRIGENATPPDNPVKEGTNQFEYTFVGWIGDYNNVQDDLIVYAEFSMSLKKFKITYISFGEVYKEKDAFFGETLNLVASPDNSDHKNMVFDGWYLDEECTVLADENIKVNSDITLYASWKEETHEKSGCACGIIDFTTNFPALILLVTTAVVLICKKKSGYIREK